MTERSIAASTGSQRGLLGLFMVVMLMFGIITSLNGMAPLATYGLGSLFYLAIAIAFFLIPAALVAAELGTSSTREGGVYAWVSDAFGPRAGFLATWLQWLQNVIFWTVVLTSSAAMMALSVGWKAGVENKRASSSRMAIRICPGLRQT